MTKHLTGTREEWLAARLDPSKRDTQSRVASNIQDRPPETRSGLEPYWTRALNAFKTYVEMAQDRTLPDRRDKRSGDEDAARGWEAVGPAREAAARVA
jgi:hypothetical protein